MGPASRLYAKSDDVDQTYTIISYVTLGLCVSLTSIFVAVRLYARYRVYRCVDKEDYLCIISWLCATGYFISIFFYTYFGGGHHIWELDLHQIQSSLHALYPQMLFYILSNFFIKILILAMIIRIFCPFGFLAHMRTAEVLIYIFALCIVLYYMAIFFVRVFVCNPISAFWNGAGHCITLDAVFIVDAFISLITDGIILALPICLTWRMNLSLRKKVKIAAILGAGGMAIISNIYRLYLVFTELGTTDTTFYVIHLLYTGAAEVAIGLICTCLPALSAWYMKCKTQGEGLLDSGEMHCQGQSQRDLDH